MVALKFDSLVRFLKNHIIRGDFHKTAHVSICKLKPQPHSMSNDTIGIIVECICHPHLFTETQSALNCGMVWVRGRESSKLWALGDTNIRDSFDHQRGRKWQGPQDSHSTDCYEVCGMQKNGCRKRGILFYLSIIWAMTATCTANLHNPPKAAWILMHFWITSADGIYFREAYKYVLLDDKRPRKAHSLCLMQKWLEVLQKKHSNRLKYAYLTLKRCKNCTTISQMNDLRHLPAVLKIQFHEQCGAHDVCLNRILIAFMGQSQLPPFLQ